MDRGLYPPFFTQKRQASSRNSAAIGLLINQEKAYDRIYPHYFRATLLVFGFPDRIYTVSVTSSSTPISRSTLMGTSTHQSLKVEDYDREIRSRPSSSTWHWNHFCGRCNIMNHTKDMNSSTGMTRVQDRFPPQLQSKLTYAGDIFVFLQDTHDLDRVVQHMDLYQRASNTRFNKDKVQAVSLSEGPPSDAEHAISTLWHSSMS
ncbi:hypothetical protein BX666DRAFT_692595 [Dichotomocladium elegans]|nr:hypothetical protein BX666DRAFT_692595 [Dichotomocladium elegans]